MKQYVNILMALAAVLFCACNAETNMKKGDQFYSRGEFFDAAAQYKTAYTRTAPKERDKRGERALKMADCYRRINSTAKAIAAYQNAVRYKVKDSTAILYLAQMQHKNGDYKSAARNYDAYLKTDPLNKLAQRGLQSCLLAPQWKQNPNRYIVKRQDFFNSRRSDYCPALGGDEYDQLFFTSTRPQAHGSDLSGITGVKNGDICVAKKDEKGKWKQPEVMESDVNTDEDEGACCFTPDSKTMYYTYCGTDPSYPRYAQIYESSRSDASWKKGQLLEISKDTLSSYAHPAVTPDGQWLYFVSDMPGGQGGLDIWRIRLTTNGLGGVENLGEEINTPGNEMFPTFRPNGEFYFSSDGRGGMGGLDIFKAVCDSVTKHWTVENLQYPMNSQGDDFGMTFEGLHNRGYFSSNRGDARGWDHIFSFELPEILQTVKGWVYEKDGYELPSGLVYMVGDDGTNLKLSVKGDGSFEQIIKPNVHYAFLGTCKGYLNHREELCVDTVHESKEYTLQFALASITAPVLVPGIFYEFDKADLTPDSKTALDELYKILIENPNITIELSAHCDYRGSDAYNVRLSQRRAESVVKYLIAKGIPAERMTPMGYGKSRPKVIKKKLTETYPFLHENDSLTEAFIKKLNKQQQDTCNALNRRTEFKVLRTTYGLMETLRKEAAAEQKKAEKQEENSGSATKDD
jgi:peptidoglycan-associated lipoprotein